MICTSAIFLPLVHHGYRFSGTLLSANAATLAVFQVDFQGDRCFDYSFRTIEPAEKAGRLFFDEGDTL
jgi:hypothetical protein